jgi:hypothetical protein
MVAIYDPEDENEWIVIVRGDNWTQSFNVKDDAGDPFDLSAWSDWTAQWRSSFDDEVAYDLQVVSGGVTGVLTIAAPPADTVFMGNANGWVDIQAADPEVRTFVQARTHYRKDVTRA